MWRLFFSFFFIEFALSVAFALFWQMGRIDIVRRWT